MGSDKLKTYRYQMGRDKLKISIYGVENDQKLSKFGLEKSGRFVIFLVRFSSFLSKTGPIRIYR
jgi:hypothetical protein